MKNVLSENCVLSSSFCPNQPATIHSLFRVLKYSGLFCGKFHSGSVLEKCFPPNIYLEHWVNDFRVNIFLFLFFLHLNEKKNKITKKKFPVDFLLWKICTKHYFLYSFFADGSWSTNNRVIAVNLLACWFTVWLAFTFSFQFHPQLSH